MAGPHDEQGTGPIPFWVHQVVELLLGMLLLIQGARTEEHTALLFGLGGLLLLLTLCSEGGLGAWPWIGRRLHRVLDLVAALVLALSPLLLGFDDVFAVVVVEAAALAMVWLALRTNWKVRAKRQPRREPPRAATTEPAPPAPPSPPAIPSTPTASGTDVPLARTLGAGAARVRDDGPRQLGRFVGRARRATKAAFSPPDDPDPEPPASSSP